ncbi:MAG: DUF3365 domain-containing protein [Planctomycetales bacterium]|nr:DUF3365 domain-containing protein [Planctomycetales bacterium]
MILENAVVHLRLFPIFMLALALVQGDEKQSTSQSKSQIEISPPSTLEEARSRAKLLHEMVRGALQIMHRDFFDEEDAHAIPSASLEDVFHEMGKSYDVQMKWLTVNTDLVNVDHQAKSAFEKAAVKELAAGKQMAEKIEERSYQYAGAIRLGSQCLKCHVQRRTSNEDRTAGVVITMSILAAPKYSPAAIPAETTDAPTK